jgi:hypothetical protein
VSSLNGDLTKLRKDAEKKITLLGDDEITRINTAK